MYLLIFRGGHHLFSFYVNSAKKKISVGGDEGDILFPPEISGQEMVLRKEFDIETKEYSWFLYPSSNGFKLNGEPVKPGTPFQGNDVFSISDFSFSFSMNSNLSLFSSKESSLKVGNTIIMEDDKTEYKNIVLTYGGNSRTFSFRNDRTVRIGRKNTDIVVGFNEVSSEHLALVMKPNGIYFQNKGKNGTWINGVKVEKGFLDEGKYNISIAGRHDVSLAVNKEKVSESFYSGSLAGHFEQIENWVNQPNLFSTHPIIFLTGESGVGKEVFAEFVHTVTGRKGKFVTYNAASIPETLAESELFGTVKGGFTGAEEREGAFFSADGGTLFLDEIAEMPVNLQSKLLRVLEDWMVKKIGESGNGKKVDVVLVLATNREIEEAVEDGTFRKDLYYRLSTLQVKIPPLRERKEDIIPLARYLHFALTGRDLSIEKEAEDKLKDHEWSGNVRELKSVITRFAYSGKDTFTTNDF